MSEKTAEQIAAEKAQKDLEAKAEKERLAAQKKAEKEAKAAEAKAEKERLTAEKKAKAEAAKAEKEAAKAAKEAEKAAKLAAKEAAKVKQPEQNGVVRPKATSACGKIWEIADQLSAKAGSPVAIAALLETAQAEGYNEATIKTQYARWRKFHGVTGRVVVQVAQAAPATEQAAPEASA